MAQASQQDPQQPLKNQRVSTPQPRYTQDEIDSAVAAQLPLFTFDLNYPRQVPLPAGRTIRRSTTIGLLSEEEARWIVSKIASVHHQSIAELAIAEAHRDLMTKVVGVENLTVNDLTDAASYLATASGPHPPSILGARLANETNTWPSNERRLGKLLAAGALLARAIDLLRKG